MKKIVALFLSFLLVLETFSIGASAMESSIKEEALTFIESKGFITEEIISEELIDNGIKFTLKYLSSGDIATTTYIKYANNDILIIIEENAKTNEILFKSDGTVLFNGVETERFNFSTTPSLTATYASYMCEERSLPGTCDRVFEKSVGEVTPISLALPVMVKNCTISVLASIITGNLGWTNATPVAESIAGTLIGFAWGDTSIQYRATVTRDDNQAPLQYFYKYTETWSGSGQSWPHKTYKVENLL